MTSQPLTATPLSRCGLGLRTPHVAEVIATRPDVPWFEVHAENYLGGGRRLAQLDAIRRKYPISLHGVGLSLGGAARLDDAHLRRIRELVRRTEPVLVSEHLAWSRFAGVYFNDLLPLPYSEESLDPVARNIAELQEALGREILIENPSRYLSFAESRLPEHQFLAELVARTGCGLLCDVNNIYVSAVNFGDDPIAWLDGLPAAAVREIHLAGHHVNQVGTRQILIDDHGCAVAPPVWDLYSRAVKRFPQAAPLIEWDTNIPALSILIAEARQANLRRQRAFEEEALDVAAA